MALALAGIGLLSSCDEWLNLTPENAIPAEDYWKSESDVASALNGIYIEWTAQSSEMWIRQEMRADMLQPGSARDGNYTLIREGNITSSNSLCSWLPYYSVINQCNVLLERSAMALANDPSYTETQDNIYKAQARVIRAKMYFDLIRIWKDVPYITFAYYDDDTERNVGATDRLTILDAIIEELETVQSEAHLPYTYSTTSKAETKGRCNMYMLKALLADMYRMKGSYATDPTVSQSAYNRCVSLCNEVIESGQYALIPYAKTNAKDGSLLLEDATTAADSAFYDCSNASTNTWFNALYVAGNSTESIMELQIDDEDAASFYSKLVNGGRPTYSPNTSMLTTSLFPPTEKDLASAYGYADGRRRFCYFPGMPTLIWKHAGRSIDGGLSDYYSNSAEYKRNVIVYRLAEIYLMKAEALVQIALANGNDQQTLLEAYRAVFKVRDRAGAVETTDCELGSGGYVQDRYWDQLHSGAPIALAAGELSGVVMEQFILNEEARELAYEGRRWFDVLRNTERNAEGTGSCTGGSLSYLISIAADCTTEDKIAYIQGQMRKPEFRYLPYPYNDVSNNKALDQKPFWGTE